MKSVYLFAAVFIVPLLASPASAQGQKAPAVQYEDIQPEAFSAVLKTEWMYLREAFDQWQNEIQKRGEFETTTEFQSRVAHSRQAFLDKLAAHLREAKLDRKVFGLWFRATFDSYDADAGVYSLKTPDLVEAPYEIPTVNCFIPENPFVGIADSIRGGYRTSQIYLRFNPDFKWVVARDEAMKAKAQASSILFRVQFVIRMTLDSEKNRAVLKMIPKDIALMNPQTKFVYWKEDIRSSAE